MGLPEVGADVITGATVTMGAPVKGMDEVDGNIGALEGMDEVDGNIGALEGSARL